MGFLDDQNLVKQIRSGDQQAFVVLIRRYERSLAALIRDRIGSADAVEDVLQETLVHAWKGLRLQAPRHVRAWLYQVARTAAPTTCARHNAGSALSRPRSSRR